MKIFNLKSKAAGCVLVATVLMSSCKKDIQAPNAADGAATQSRAVYNSISTEFYSTLDKEYTQANYIGVAGNDQKNNWRSGAQWLVGSTLRVRLEPGLLAGPGGCIAETAVTDGSDYTVTYETKLGMDQESDLSEGGKIGWGFGIGLGASDGNNNGGEGASIRIMWHKENGMWVFKPYLYYATMPAGSYGQQLNCTPFRIYNNVWYKIYIHVKTNTAHTDDGYIKVSIKKSSDTNYTDVLVNSKVKWTYGGAKINRLTFDTFRGGKEDYWKSANVGHIFYDNLSFHP